MSTSTITPPETVEALGVQRNILEDLALKILAFEGELTIPELSERMKVSLPVADEIFQRLRKEKNCEVKGMVAGIYRIVVTSGGRTRAQGLLGLNRYTGPAPVSLEEYSRRVLEQTVQAAEIRPVELERALEHLVISDQMLKQLGTAVVSGTTIFLHGPSGTGKTAIAESLPSVYNDHIYLPYAVEVGGQIITIYDRGFHQKVQEDSHPDEVDCRWVLCRRPRVVVGGELTDEMLDLQFNPVTKFYSAPLQMKANNGVLIIDDFGRQRIQPEDMLNRWIVPLDRRVDFLHLAGGKSFEIPFDLFVVFATNLNPTDLVDAAFLRRIQNKIKVDYVTPDYFHSIFQGVCKQFELVYDREVVDRFLKILEERKEPRRPCYPRDIARQVCWAARYEGRPPKLDHESIRAACDIYFLET